MDVQPKTSNFQDYISSSKPRDLAFPSCGLVLITDTSWKMLRTIRDKFKFVSETAGPIWADLIEPKSDRSPFEPLHNTLFSVRAIQYTRFYSEVQTQYKVGTRPEEQIKLPLEFLANGVRVLFYEDQPWFGDNRNELKRYAQWCDTNHGSNYQITLDKAAAYIHFRVEQKRVELAATGPTRKDVLPETSLFGRARNVVPVLERYAKWQGYLELSKNLSSQGPVEILYTDLLRQSNTAKAVQPIDYAADSRRMAKRLHEDERTR